VAALIRRAFLSRLLDGAPKAERNLNIVQAFIYTL
jgi:hypothetical protein